MQESFEESHKQQLEELRINLQKEHETRHSDVVSQHQMEMKSLREFIDTEHREKFEVKFVSEDFWNILYDYTADPKGPLSIRIVLIVSSQPCPRRSV